MQVFVSIIVFLIILALLVIVHEFGHFIMAKRAGMQVEEFGFGFPPRLFGIRKGETLYSVNALPLGGFVKIVGENNEDYDNPRSFVNKSFIARFSTLVAGVVMNIILAWVLVSIGFGIGLPTEVSVGQSLPAHAVLRSQSLAITQVAPDSAASSTGLKEGDSIAAVDGRHFADLDDIINYLHANQGAKFDFELMRGKSDEHVIVQSKANPAANEGSVGISIDNVGIVSFPWYIAPVIGLKATWQIISQIFTGFWALFSSGQGLSSLGGPVRIAALTNQVTQLGISYIIQFAAFLSVNLAILNIIPFPALDGGRVLFLIIEKIRGKRNNQKIEGYANIIGFSLLILFIVFISVHDVRFLIHK